MQEMFLDFDSDPGIQPCDRCRRIQPCEWFGAMLLCQECLIPVIQRKAGVGEVRHDLIEIVTLDALAKAGKRLAAVNHQLEQARKSLAEMVQFMEGFLERGAARTAKIEELLDQWLKGVA